MKNYSEADYEKNMNLLNIAVQYCTCNFSHEDIINELYNDNDLKKQLCLIKINKINSQDEADILCANLTGKSGLIREAASFAVLKLIKRNKTFFQSRIISDIFVKAITDINPSVSRNILEIITNVENAQYLYENIINEIRNTLKGFDNVRKNRSYIANKKNFNLYWNLEALTSISGKIKTDENLHEILKITALSNDYTIREKTAKAAKEFSKYDGNFKHILDIMRNDENIYVRKYL